MGISQGRLHNKVIGITATIVVMFTFLLVTGNQALASPDEQETSWTESDPVSLEFPSESSAIPAAAGILNDLASQTSSALDAENIDKSRLNYFSLAMPQLDNRVRNVLVYLPEGYETGEESYPVIYLQDAQNTFIQSGFSPDERSLNEELFKFFASGFTGEKIIVGVEYDQIHMWDEYSPWVNQNMYLYMDPYDANQVEGGEGDAYLDFLVETLKPEIDARYRTLHDRENTAVGGSMMGGLLSVYAGLSRSNVFSTVLAMSPAIWFAESGGTWLSSNQLINFIEQKGVPSDVRFFLDVTAEDRITDLVVRPAVSRTDGSQITFPQAYLEGVQALVDVMVEEGLPLSNIIGGAQNPHEWTETLKENPAIFLDVWSFSTYLPLISKPAFPPEITSPAATVFTKSMHGSFTVTTTGLPTPSISYTGGLPSGLTFTDNGNGTATIAGTTNVVGTYYLTITAQNGVEPNAIQNFTLKVVEGCPDSGSCLVTFSMSMRPYLNRTRNISVYLPPNYNAGAYYPVIYLMDAQHMFGFPIAHPLAIDDWKMDEKLDNYYYTTGRGVIAVGIWFDSNYPWSEYTLSANLNMDHWVNNAPQLSSPEGAGLINFIRYSLKPEVDSSFRTLKDRNNTAIGGGSRCALLALNAALHVPETFSKVMAMSPAVWIAEGGIRVAPPNLTTWFSDNGLQKWFNGHQSPTNVKYFLYIGEREQSGILYPYVQKAEEPGVQIPIEYAYFSGYIRVMGSLTADGVPASNIKGIVNADGTHHGSVWSAYIIQAITWFGY